MTSGKTYKKKKKDMISRYRQKGGGPRARPCLSTSAPGLKHRCHANNQAPAPGGLEILLAESGTTATVSEFPMRRVAGTAGLHACMLGMGTKRQQQMMSCLEVE